jgi:hypothetical protein
MNSIPSANPADVARQLYAPLIEDRDIRIRILQDALATAIARAQQAEAELIDAAQALRGLNEETIEAGLPHGDRVVTLANIRELRAQRDELRSHAVMDSELIDAALEAAGMALFSKQGDRVPAADLIAQLAAERDRLRTIADATPGG